MIIGHQRQWQFLVKSADVGRLSHAYLFLGQGHLGKKTIAKELIKLINCRNTPHQPAPNLGARDAGQERKRPCHTCWSCRAFQKETHPDLILIRPEGKEIKIPQIRGLQYFFSLKPHSSNFKAAILDKAERMNQEAQSCLLKTLEEPSGNTLIFLITEYPEMLFPTILSRAQQIKFFPVSESEIKNNLKRLKIPLAKVKKIVSLSFGRPGQALELSRDDQKLESEYQKIKDIDRIANQDLALRFQYIKTLTSQEQDLKEILESWLRYFREILKTKIGLPPEFKTSPSSLSLSLPHLRRIINSIEKINFLIYSTNINPRLALETLMIQF